MDRTYFYRLKRLYGQSATLRHKLAVVVDIVSGTEQADVEEVQIVRAVLVPYSVASRIARTTRETDLEFGGEVSVTARTILLDKRDVPSTFQILAKDEIVMEGITYHVVERTEFVAANAWQVRVEVDAQ
jgi:hypothetical protein